MPQPFFERLRGPYMALKPSHFYFRLNAGLPLGKCISSDPWRGRLRDS